MSRSNGTTRSREHNVRPKPALAWLTAMTLLLAGCGSSGPDVADLASAPSSTTEPDTGATTTRPSAPTTSSPARTSTTAATSTTATTSTIATTPVGFALSVERNKALLCSAAATVIVGDLLVSYCDGRATGFDLRTQRIRWTQEFPQSGFAGMTQVDTDVVVSLRVRQPATGLQPAQTWLEVRRLSLTDGATRWTHRVENDDGLAVRRVLVPDGLDLVVVWDTTSSDGSGSVEGEFVAYGRSATPLWRTAVACCDAQVAKDVVGIGGAYYDATTGRQLWSIEYVDRPRLDNAASPYLGSGGTMLDARTGVAIGKRATSAPNDTLFADGALTHSGSTSRAGKATFYEPSGAVRWTTGDGLVEDLVVVGGSIFLRNTSDQWVEVDRSTGKQLTVAKAAPSLRFAKWDVFVENARGEPCVGSCSTWRFVPRP